MAINRFGVTPGDEMKENPHLNNLNTFFQFIYNLVGFATLTGWMQEKGLELTVVYWRGRLRKGLNRPKHSFREPSFHSFQFKYNSTKRNKSVLWWKLIYPQKKLNFTVVRPPPHFVSCVHKLAHLSQLLSPCFLPQHWISTRQNRADLNGPVLLSDGLLLW